MEFSIAGEQRLAAWGTFSVELDEPPFARFNAELETCFHPTLHLADISLRSAAPKEAA